MFNRLSELGLTYFETAEEKRMKSTKMLMADHESILEALHILEAISNEVEHGKAINKDDTRALLTFLRDFADGSHHVKEEAIFFPALMQAGMTFQEGPLRVMTYEHQRGRALTAAMDEALARNDNHDFVMYARRYIELLTEHIEKENYVLFDMADQMLTDEEDQKIAEGFRHFEQTIVSTATYVRLQDILESLAAKYLGGAVVH
jgi:hemerythrin-like domain-containing protein